MTNQLYFDEFHGYGNNVDASDIGFLTDDRQFAPEPTSGQWPTSNIPNSAAAAFPLTRGSFQPSTAPIFTSYDQVPESQQAYHYLGKAAAPS